MTDTRNSSRGAGRWPDEEGALRGLLRNAGPRPPLPQDDLAAITEAARSEWQRRYGEPAAARRRGRVRLSLAAAALLAAVGLVWMARRPAAPPAEAAPAALQRVTGAARWTPPGGRPVPIEAGAAGRGLSRGSALETGPPGDGAGRVAVRMAGGASLRLDTGARLHLVSATEVELVRGAVYVDTGGEGSRGEEVAVRTRAGLFQAIGTQFEVRADETGEGARLRVREGRVVLRRGGSSLLTDAGNELRVRREGTFDRRRFAAYGPEWAWVMETAPVFALEGVTVRAYLSWVAREAGWQVEFADREAAARSDTTILHGSIAHLSPAETPGVVLASGGLGHRVSGGALIVFVAGKEGR